MHTVILITEIIIARMRLKNSLQRQCLEAQENNMFLFVISVRLAYDKNAVIDRLF